MQANYTVIGKPKRLNYGSHPLRFFQLLEFLQHIPENNSCMVWPYGHTAGYGTLSIPDWISVRGFESRTNRYICAHILAYALTNGPITGGLEVLHKCDNPPCFRPSHLALGTHAENMQDCQNKGRMYKVTSDGHPKLFENDVAKIWHEHLQLRKALAARFNISKSDIDAILQGKIRRQCMPKEISRNLRAMENSHLRCLPDT